MKKSLIVLTISILIVLFGCSSDKKFNTEYENLKAFYEEYKSISNDFSLIDKMDGGYTLSWTLSRDDIYDIEKNDVKENLPNGGLDESGIPLCVTFTCTLKNGKNENSFSFTIPLSTEYLSSDAKEALNRLNNVISLLKEVKEYSDGGLINSSPITNVTISSSEHIESTNGNLVCNIEKLNKDTLSTGSVIDEVNIKINVNGVVIDTDVYSVLYSSFYKTESKTIEELKTLSRSENYSVYCEVLYSSNNLGIIIDDNDNQILINHTLSLETGYSYKLLLSGVYLVNGIERVDVLRVLDSSKIKSIEEDERIKEVWLSDLSNNDAQVVILKSVSVSNSKNYMLTSEITFYTEDGNLLSDSTYENLYGAYIPLDETHSKFIVINKN